MRLKSVFSQVNWKVCESEQSQNVDSYEGNTQWHHFVTEIFHKLHVVFEEFFLSQGIQEVENPPDYINKGYTKADQCGSENVLSASIGVSIKEPLASTNSRK